MLQCFAPESLWAQPQRLSVDPGWGALAQLGAAGKKNGAGLLDSLGWGPLQKRMSGTPQSRSAQLAGHPGVQGYVVYKSVEEQSFKPGERVQHTTH